MSSNIFSPIIRVGEQTFGNDDFFEVRIENDSDGNPLYVGRSPISGAATDEQVWFIIKLTYDINGHLDHIIQPSNGRAFVYAWDDRASYF